MGLLAGFSQAAEARVYVPTPKVVFEVRTAQGDLRSYQRPGLAPTYWDQSFPALQGDKVTVDPLVATGGAELGSVKVSVDGTGVADLSKAPWRTVVDTAGLALGEHAIEVKAKTAAPHAREGTAKATLVVLPQDERVGKLPAAGATESEGERLSAVIGCLDPEIDAALDASATASLTEPELFHASAGPAAKEYFYTLSREGKVFYTSPLLPITTFVLLEPEGAAAPAAGAAEGKTEGGQQALHPRPTDTSAGAGMRLAPGEVLLTLQVGNGEGRFGPPVWATLAVTPEAETPGEVTQ
jgi:hypothetical protein